MFGNSLTKFLKLDNLISNLTGFVETKIELVKIEIKKEASEGAAREITYAVIAFVFAMVLLFISLGVAIVLSDRLGAFAGYGIVAVIYLIAGVVLIANRESLFRNIEKQLSQPSKKKK